VWERPSIGVDVLGGICDKWCRGTHPDRADPRPPSELCVRAQSGADRRAADLYEFFTPADAFDAGSLRRAHMAFTERDLDSGP
jgi:hypothetical protein